MGKKLDVLLGRRFKTSKFKRLVKLAISRMAILKNRQKVRYFHAMSDVVQLLNLGNHESALLRVEHVIKDRNMIDVYTMIECYCHLLIERVALLQKNKDCPDELKEAISSLIFASSRCGEFPELIEIRGIFVSRFGKEFANGAVELRNKCGVHPEIIQKFSAAQPSLESRMKVLKDTASENGILLHLGEDAFVNAEFQEKLDVSQNQNQQESNKSANLIDETKPREETHVCPEKLNPVEILSETLNVRKYKDVAAAAQEAFESAAYAAAAARAAFRLSITESQENDPDDHNGSSHQQEAMYGSSGSLTPKLAAGRSKSSEHTKHFDDSMVWDKIYPIGNISSESEGEDEDVAEFNGRTHQKETEESQNKTGID